MRPRRIAPWILACASALPASALECDQYFAWGRTLRDASDAINAKVDADMAEVLEDVNRLPERGSFSCQEVERRVVKRFIYLIFLRPETWATNTSLIDRVPSAPEEELRFRTAYVYGRTPGLDIIRWMPPSPTIEVDGVRMGTDKLSHFFSEGLWYHRWYRTFRERGLDHDEAVRRAVLRGVTTERTILGGTSSGVLSLGDLEANYQGMRFYNSFCDAATPNLVWAGDAWRLTRPFDLRGYVSPEWDESWQPNVFTPKRWERVLPVLLEYCAALTSPEVAAQREAYRARDRATLSESIVADLVKEGKLLDPAQFSIDAICGLPARGLGAAAPAPGSDAGEPVPGAQDVEPGGR